MTPQEQRILELAQSIALARTSRYSDVEDELERNEFLDQTIDWVNQYIQELELEADWNYVRNNDYAISSGLVEGDHKVPLPVDVQRLVISSDRDLSIVHDGTTISTFGLVAPNQIANPTNPETRDRATIVGRQVILSRPLTAEEAGGELYADAVKYIPRLSRNNVEMLDLVEPPQLIVLGVAKNWSLPDIVQGGISPNLAQKYNDLLQLALAKNNETSQAYDAIGDDFSYIGGIW